MGLRNKKQNIYRELVRGSKRVTRVREAGIAKLLERSKEIDALNTIPGMQITNRYTIVGHIRMLAKLTHDTTFGELIEQIQSSSLCSEHGWKVTHEIGSDVIDIEPSDSYTSLISITIFVPEDSPLCFVKEIEETTTYTKRVLVCS